MPPEAVELLDGATVDGCRLPRGRGVSYTGAATSAAGLERARANSVALHVSGFPGHPAVMCCLTFLLMSVLALQTFSSRTLGVRVDLLVMDGTKPVAGLTARDFELRDNGVLQRVDVVDAVDVPINVVLALDTSASIRGRRLTDLIAAGDAILDGLKPVDRAAIVTFNHAVTLALQLSADLVEARAALRAIDPGGRTSVMDGVSALTSTIDQAGRFLLVGADPTAATP